MKAIGCLIVLFLFSFSSVAVEIKEIVWISPEWKGYTNKDETGIYNEIMNQVFQEKGIKIIRVYAPWKRSLVKVQASQADVTGGEVSSSLYYQSKYPLTVSRESIFFEKVTIGNWAGIQSIENKKGVWIRGYSLGDKELEKRLKIQINDSRENALKMVFWRRVDYYVDSHSQLLKTLENAELPFNQDEYQIETIKELYLYMSFSKTNRGKRIRDLYDEGIERLYRTKKTKLKELYEKEGLLLPDLDI